MSEIVPGNCLFVNSDLAVTKELWVPSSDGMMQAEIFLILFWELT
jgi:hypothetical protein